MSSNPAFDYATPYDIMVGLWTVQKIIYGPKGEYLDSAPSFVAVYWEKRHKLMHFREDEPDTRNSSKRFARRAAVARVVSLEFDLKVEGKYSHGESSRGVKITGTETRPDVYHFHLQDEGGDWYNNHYLISPNERHVLGPFVEKNGKIEEIVAQTLTRVSYDVPMKYKRGLHRSGK
jgi:hypothetical protein